MDGSNDLALGSASGSPPRAMQVPTKNHDGQRFELADGDAVEWLRALPASSVDLVITDPPYESLEKHRAIGTTTRLKHSKASSNDWFTIFPNRRFPELFAEVYRVLRRDSHFYLFCDQETMFVAKPIAEAAGFKFWKPIVWDKCIAPQTPVWTDRGVVTAGCINVGDRVASRSGRFVHVLATRRVVAPAVRIRLTTGAELTATPEHRFLRANGQVAPASELAVGDTLFEADVRCEDAVTELNLEELIADEDRILELPDPRHCLFCGKTFESSRATAAHQARFCELARSKEDMAAELGVTAKRLRRWMSDGRLPATWARTLGLEELATGRHRASLQNDGTLWFPRSLPMSYDLGRFVGLYAAEGSASEVMVSFALHRDENTLAAFLARFVRALGVRSSISPNQGNGVVLNIAHKAIVRMVRAFVGGTRAPEKYLKPLVYAAPDEFRRGVLAGLLEGDGSWSHDEQRETLNVSSLDLATFAFRTVRAQGFAATIHRFENSGSGGWRVRWDPSSPTQPVTIASIENFTIESDFVDIAIDDPEQLYLLGDGIVTHNCAIGMGYHYRSRYEFILFFEKGKRKLADLGVSDIITQRRIVRGYPAEKPVEVSEVLVRQSTSPGAIVADPFMGSGSVGVAALRLGRRFIGTDISPSARELTEQRLSGEIGASPAVQG